MQILLLYLGNLYETQLKYDVTHFHKTKLKYTESLIMYFLVKSATATTHHAMIFDDSYFV